MSKTVAFRPPEPIDSWPKDLALAAGQICQRGTSIFEGTGEPWSTARRFEGGVQMEWEGVCFEVTADTITVDTAQPTESVDLYWNTLIATVLELRGLTCLHGFMVEAPDGSGLAILGNSGAGKTTTGRALLRAGCTLVCDDLVTLGAGASPIARPFVRRLLEPGEVTATDVGGKVREPHALTESVPALSRVLILDVAAGETATRLAPMQALDHILRNPYVPMEVASGSAARRLGAILEQVKRLDAFAGRPKSRTPDEFASLLLNGVL